MPKNIILIDDNSADNVLHERIIRETFAEADVSIVDNGDEAMTFLTRELSNSTNQDKKLILIDANMSGISALAVLQRLEDNLDIDPNQTEVYLLTNRLSEGLVEHVGSFPHVKKIICKPFTHEDAQEMLRTSDEPIEERHPTP